MEAAPAGAYLGALVVDDVATNLAASELVSREQVESEIDLMYATIRTFYGMEPDQVLLCISAFSARCAELETLLYRAESKREWTRVRTMQVERLHKELEIQFRVHSRLIEMRRQDLELNRGMR